MRNVLVRKRIPRPLSFRHRSSLARAEIGFITDVEGDWSYFEQCIARSRVLYRDGSKKLQLRAAGPELTRGSSLFSAAMRSTTDLVIFASRKSWCS